MRDSANGSTEKNWHLSGVFTNLCDRTGTHGQAGSGRSHRKQPCFREGGMTRHGEQWGNKAQSRLQLGHLRRQNNWQLEPLQNTVTTEPTGFFFYRRTWWTWMNMILTCVGIPDICHPILATREDEIPTWCESAIDPLSVVCGSSVLLYSQAERGR